MVRRVFLHIGVMKSATSYLQGLCEENAEELAAAGLWWCPDHLRYGAVRQVIGKARPGATLDGSWAVVADGLRGHPGDALISNELLAGVGPRQAGRLVAALAPAEVHVVVTARDLARVIPSHWQTTVKNGSTWTWQAFAASVCSDGLGAGAAEAGAAGGDRDRDGDGADGDGGRGQRDPHAWFWRRHDLAAIARRWRQWVPTERITVVTVPAGPTELTTAARFGSVLGVDLAGLDQPLERRNPSLGAHSAELLRRINSPMTDARLDDPEHRYERALGGALALHAGQEPSYGLTPGQRDWALGRATAMVADVERLGVEVVGDLTDLLPTTLLSTTEPGEQLADPGDTTDAELLVAATRGLVALAPVYNELRRERDDLRVLRSAASG